LVAILKRIFPTWLPLAHLIRTGVLPRLTGKSDIVNYSITVVAGSGPLQSRTEAWMVLRVPTCVALLRKVAGKRATDHPEQNPWGWVGLVRALSKIGKLDV